MKQVTFFSLMLTFVLASGIASAADYIRVGTSDIDLIFKVNGDGRLCQSYFGTKLTHDSDIGWLGDGQEAFAVYGQDDYFEPALKITHADGNVSLRMKYVSDETVAVDDNVDHPANQPADATHDRHWSALSGEHDKHVKWICRP